MNSVFYGELVILKKNLFLIMTFIGQILIETFRDDSLLNLKSSDFKTYPEPIKIVLKK